MHNGVYILRFQSGYFYIGSTGNFKKRQYYHIRDFIANKNSPKLQRVFTTVDALRWEWIDCPSREDAFDLEARFIDRYINDPLCCNTVNPMDPGAHQFGRILSEETKRLIRSSPPTEMTAELRARISATKTGVPHSTTHALNMKKATQESRGHKVEINGVIYPSIRDAGRAIGVTGPTVLSRARSSKPEFVGWRLLESKD